VKEAVGKPESSDKSARNQTSGGRAWGRLIPRDDVIMKNSVGSSGGANGALMREGIAKSAGQPTKVYWLD